MQMTIIGLLQRLAVRMNTRLTLVAAVSPPLTSRVTFGNLNLRPCTTMSTYNTDTTPLDTIFKQKKTLRLKVKRELKSMDPTLRSQEDEAIQRIVLEAPWFKSCKRLCAYITCGPLREVDTSVLLAEILTDTGDQKKKLYVPRVEDKNSHMRMLNISRMDDLVANSMSILEPTVTDAEGNERENVMFAEEPVDLFLLPGLAFDKSGRRLGRGGGYYDTLLTKYRELAEERKWKKPLLVALSYSVQILDEDVIPVTQHDVQVDALVSPSGLIPITPSATEMCS